MYKLVFAGIAAGALLAGCATEKGKSMPDYPRLKEIDKPSPLAETRDHQFSHHGISVDDPYNWLRDKDYPKVDDEDVLDYLRAENAYFDAFLEPNKPLVDTLFEEFKGRVNESETSVPWQVDGYEYRWYYEEGEDYKTWSRKPITGGEEKIFLSETALAEGHEYFDLGSWDISPNQRYLAYSFNTKGDERFTVRIRDLRSGELLEDVLSDTGGTVIFSADSQHLLYNKLEADKWRVESINSHTLGAPQAQDVVLYKEQNDGYFTQLGLSSSRDYFLIYTGQGETTEVHAIKSDDIAAGYRTLVSRDQEVDAKVDHANGNFYMLVNDTHVNSRLVTLPDAESKGTEWQTLIEGSDEIYLRSLQAFKSFLVLKERVKGVDHIRIMDYDGKSKRIEFPETVYAASIGNNPAFDQAHVRVQYESMITPDTVFDYDVKSETLTTRKVKEIPSGYDKSEYETKRVMATARDGVQIPISLVYKKGFKQDGSQPLYLYAYGAYGSAVSPTFSTIRKSLLDRGFAYAIAHIRGGDMMGYQWYLDGKLKKRTNTFNDFVDAARYLVDENYVSAGNISIAGRSAGGELMGAVTIQAPELWRSVTLGVPFVDVLNTMLDASLPLTPPEWVEWGNPITSKEDFELIQSYSPYDNITAREYPPMLVTGGLNDPRVTYWEPAKWTAKMRAMKTDDNLLVMRMNMGAGHFANSGRYGRLRDYAEEYVFTLLAHGITE